MYYYNFHIGDYKAHTHHLSLIEDIAFRRLLDLYYTTEKPIIEDQAARLIGMRDHGDEVLCVLREFFAETTEGFINKRADKEIAAYKAMSEGGKRGAQKRWNDHRNREAMPTLSPGDDHPKAPLIATNNQEPITNNQVNNIPPDGGIDLAKDLFDSAKQIGIKASMIGKAIRDVGEIETMAALESSSGQENPTNAFAASIRNRTAKIKAAGETAEMLKPKKFDPSVLSL